MYRWTSQYKKPTNDTLNIGSVCSALIVQNSFSEGDLHEIAAYIGYRIDELLSIMRRLGQPESKPAFDGEHSEAHFYDNNVQFRLLLAAISETRGGAHLPASVLADIGLSQDDLALLLHESHAFAQSSFTPL